MNLNIDFSKTKGKIKPIHGVGNGPVTGRFTRNHTKEFIEARIPYSRLHDTEGSMGSGEFVNIHCIFKNFDADVNDPASYSFECTDVYLNDIINAGTKIFYRLGETIKNKCMVVRNHTFVPKDFQKWAEICEHIIRHYNEGWANGYHMNIEYWEIWNEPEGAPDHNPNWGGTPEEYFELYRVTANHLKKCFPNLKIGGFASTGFYEFSEEGIPNGVSTIPTDNIREGQTNHTTKFIKAFFEYITAEETKAPIDFFSWHFYGTSVERAKFEIECSQKTLETYGLGHIENILNEWNYMECWHGREGRIRKSNIGAAFTSAMHTMMQKSALSHSMYYDAEVGRRHFCGLFNEYEAYPEKPYYQFVAFGNLYELGTEVEVSEDKDGIYTLAATDGEKGGIIVTNYHKEETECNLEIKGLKGTKTCEIYITDEDITHKKVCEFTADSINNIKLTLKTDSFAFIKLI